MSQTRFAFLAVVIPEGYGLGVAEKDVRGYIPYPDGGVFQQYEDAVGVAKQLNEKLGHNPREAFLIVASSMRQAG